MVAGLDRRYLADRPWSAARRLISRAMFEGRPITTSGRWANPLILANLRFLGSVPQIRRVRKPIFIVGTGRSGTTILGMIMSIHREVGYLNEPKAMWHVIHPEDDVIGHHSRGPARYRLSEADATPEVRRTAHRVFGAYLLATGAKRVVDKNPEMIFRVPYVQAIFPDARFVLLVRDGWNACYSIANWSRQHGCQVNGETHDWWGVDNRKWRLMLDQLIRQDPFFADVMDVVAATRSRADMAVAEWVVTMREAQRQMADHPNDIHLLRYEHLVQEPEDALTRLMRFCELAADQQVVAYAKRVLNPAPRHPRFEMHPALKPLFMDVLGQLGYADTAIT